MDLFVRWRSVRVSLHWVHIDLVRIVMAHAPGSQFTVRVNARDGESDAAVAEEFALALQAELQDLGLVRVERAAPAQAPVGSRAFDLTGVFEFVVTAVQAAQSVAKVVAAIRNLADRFGQRSEQLTVAIDDAPVALR